MVKKSLKRKATKSLLKELLIGQLTQEHRLHQQQRQLKKQSKILSTLQLQLQQITTPNKTFTSATSTPMATTISNVEDDNDMMSEIQGGDWTNEEEQNSSSSSTTDIESGGDNDSDSLAQDSSNNTIDGDEGSEYREDANDNTTTIPWPGYCYKGQYFRQYLYRLPKDVVLAILREYLVNSATLDFDMQATAATRSLQLFHHIGAGTTTVFHQENQLDLTGVNTFNQLSSIMARRLVQQLNNNMAQDCIGINRSEEDWMAKYFITRYLKSKRSKPRPSTSLQHQV